MHRFSATQRSQADVPAERAQIWELVSDPDVLPQITPLLRRIVADGDVWRWEMARIAALGVAVEPSFTEQMRFTPGRRIDFRHHPVLGARERTGVEGWYLLDDAPGGGTHLSISLTVHVELPLPRASSFAVRAVMITVMAGTGDRFAANLMQRIGGGGAAEAPERGAGSATP